MKILMLTGAGAGGKYCFNAEAPFYFYEGIDGKIRFVYGELKNTIVISETVKELIDKIGAFE